MTDQTVNISFIIEWANTSYNGIPRFFGFLEILLRQWNELQAGQHPPDLEPSARGFLGRIAPQAELLIVSGEEIGDRTREQIQQLCEPQLSPAIHISPGLEYYALKNFGAELATGDILCFLDSDVYPDRDWLQHLLGTFIHDEIGAVAGRPYVAPVDLFSRAFALGWTYKLRDDAVDLHVAQKFYSNNLAFRSELFRQVGFPELRRRTRGAGSILGAQLAALGRPVWTNDRAMVDHPAPSGWKHLAIRALAHGRDMYMKKSEERNLHGLWHSQKLAVSRLFKGISNTMRHWRSVGLRFPEIVPVTLILMSYYGLFSLGGLATHVSPGFMGRHFRL